MDGGMGMDRKKFESKFVKNQGNKVALRDGSTIFADFYVFHIFGNEYVRLSFEGKGIAFVRMKSITEVYD